jgi:ElaA protein
MDTNNVTWELIHFNELSSTQLYHILQLRSEVFVVEQNCVYLDLDGKDTQCFHLFAMRDNKVIACSRIVPPGLSYNEPSIGRIATANETRGTGYGKELVQQSIDATFRLYGNTAIKIGAQLYLKKFYESFGFVQVSEIYDEDGIDHIKMLRAGA